MIKKKTHKVFVYGSLKKGFPNHHILKSSKLVSKTATKENYFMISYGRFPALIKKTPYAKISGEVYQVYDNVLRNLDRLEGNGDFYQRELIKLDNGQTAWCYFIIDDNENLGVKDSNISIFRNYKNGNFVNTQVWVG